MPVRPSGITHASFAPWIVAPVFLALAAWLTFFSSRPDLGPTVSAALIDRGDIRAEPRRHVLGEPAAIPVGGYSLRCMECHRFFQSPPVERRILTQHTHIVLRHGQNTRCFNCHDRTDRGTLIRYDGTRLGFDQVPRLCSECHGTVYRDWERGTHGKTLGSWDTASGRQRRLACHECHDPHAPAYPDYVPLPPPNTLRMGEQGSGHGAGSDSEHGRSEPATHGGGGGHESPLMHRSSGPTEQGDAHLPAHLPAHPLGTQATKEPTE